MSATSCLAILKIAAFLAFQLLSFFWLVSSIFGMSFGMRDSFCYPTHFQNVLFILLVTLVSFSPCMALNSWVLSIRNRNRIHRFVYAFMPIGLVFLSIFSILLGEYLSFVVSREHCNSAEYPKGPESMDDNAPVHWLSYPLGYGSLAFLGLYFFVSFILFLRPKFLK